MPRVTITIPDRNAQPYRFDLDRQVVSLGRGSQNDIPIDSGSVSVVHAEMRRVSGGYELHDMKSTNGIKLGGTRYPVIPLVSGNTVRVGEVSFDFLLSDEEIALLSGETQSSASAAVPLEVVVPLAKQPAAVGPIQKPSNVGALLVIMVLVAAAFFTGMSVRYQKDTGKNLIEAMRLHASVGQLPVAPSVK